MVLKLDFCIYMSTPSNWPLPPSSKRFVIPKPITEQLAINVLSSGLYPLAFGYYEHALGHSVERENHDDHLVIFCSDGKGHVETDKWRGEVQKGDVLLLPQDISHKYKAAKNEPWSIFWVHLKGHLFMPFMENLGYNSRQPVVHPLQYQDIEQEFLSLLDAGQDTFDLTNFIYAANVCKKLLGQLCIQVPNAQQKVSTDFEINQFDLYLQENLSTNITLNDMAKAVGLSKYHFAKKFQRHTGTSPMQYFLQKKVQYACHLLDSSQYTIKQIAKRLGYEDPYYFSRLFKKTMGLSPSQYRRSSHAYQS